MKTLILFSSSEIGGAEKSLSRLALAGNRDEFLLGSLTGNGSLLNNKLKSKVKIYKFGYNKISLFNLVFSCFKVIQFSQKTNIKNLYICGFRACTIIRLMSLFIRTPKIFHAIRWNPISNNLTDKVFRLMEKFFINLTEAWICNSNSASQTLIKNCSLPINKIHVVYNGIKKNKVLIKELAKRQNIVITLSNFAPRKGLIEYLDVIEKVINKNQNIKFILAGRDDMNGKVARSIHERGLEKFVKVPGFVEDIPNLLKKSRLLVIPSILPEGCPTSALEGMSWGVPVLGYNIEGLNEIIINNETGYLVKPYDSFKLSNKIIELISDKKKLEMFAANGLKFINYRFTISQMLKKHRVIFNAQQKLF